MLSPLSWPLYLGIALMFVAVTAISRLYTPRRDQRRQRMCFDCVQIEDVRIRKVKESFKMQIVSTHMRI